MGRNHGLICCTSGRDDTTLVASTVSLIIFSTLDSLVLTIDPDTTLATVGIDPRSMRYWLRQIPEIVHRGS